MRRLLLLLLFTGCASMSQSNWEMYDNDGLSEIKKTKSFSQAKYECISRSATGYMMNVCMNGYGWQRRVK